MIIKMINICQKCSSFAEQSNTFCIYTRNVFLQFTATVIYLLNTIIGRILVK